MIYNSLNFANSILILTSLYWSATRGIAWSKYLQNQNYKGTYNNYASVVNSPNSLSPASLFYIGVVNSYHICIH